ncbi:ATP-dependent DNA ligase [Terfezia boudieri ATCC MYA-4762]|uniref:DNA ligase n=1 Tax=Terfezia boudieri ATCC MYA-4762 TaxID=1051890 RepID=A0A3N4M5J1_9PEZI|nr:ATP-dependent DNA ligase [Terfezia boudieri ATCC MYA-4762]
MASPTKRRKKNDGSGTTVAGVGAGAGVRTLDFFFGRKGAAAPVGVGYKETQHSEGIGVGGDCNTRLEEQQEKEQRLETDEELARRLHEEWNGVGSANGNVNVKGSGSGGTGDSVIAVVEEEVVVIREKDGSLDGKASSSQQKGLLSKTVVSTNVPPTTLAPFLDAEAAHTTIPLDQDPLKFTPELYTPLIHSFPHSRATYALLTRCFVLINSTRSRIKIVDTLTNLLRLLIISDPHSLLPAVWLATNSIGPSYENNELGLGGSILSKAILKVSGISKPALKALGNKYGDPGDVAFDAKARQRTLGMKKMVPLTIINVYDTLHKIAVAKGSGSQEVKQRHVERLLVNAKGEEVRYLTRTLIQHLRIGAVKTTMLIALSRAFLLSRPPTSTFPIHISASLSSLPKDSRIEIYSRAEETLKECYARRPNYNDIVPALLSGGLSALQDQVPLELHIPLRPMLGSITRDLEEMLARLDGREFACEYKYDGQRAQIHCDDKGRVSIFSRHLEDMTGKYPDLVALVPRIRGEGVMSFILEGEVVAVDAATGALKTFQTLAGRARKDVGIGEVQVIVCVFAFDLMYLNGEQLLERPFRERRELLRSRFLEVPRRFTWVKSIDATSADHEGVLEFFKSALDIKCEGIMVKVLDNHLKPGSTIAADTTQDFVNGGDLGDRADDFKPPPSAPEKGKSKPKPSSDSRRKPLLSTYTPDKRLDSWLKVKKDYNTHTSETIDLVPIAGWHGSGRKSKWWSPILLAAHNPSTGMFEPVCKCISGFTDAFYTALREKYDNSSGYNTRATRPSFYEPVGGAVGEPDVWFEAMEVWEVAFGDVTLSPVYPAARGMVSEERGLSLRFPRFVKVRKDKSVEEASDVGFLAGLWEKQMAVRERVKEEEGKELEVDEGGEEAMEDDLVEEDLKEMIDEEEEREGPGLELED